VRLDDDGTIVSCRQPDGTRLIVLNKLPTASMSGRA
jgi:hypothetical protein